MLKRYLLIGLSLLSFGCGNDNTSTVGITPQPSPTIVPPIGRLATYLLAANSSPGNSIDVFRVSTDGSLARLASVPAGFGLVSLEHHGVQPFIYAGGFNSNQILGFRIDAPTGQLTPLPGFPVNSEPENNVVLDRTGNYLYSLGENAIDGFRVDQNTGSVTRLPGFPIQGLSELINGEFDRDNQYLYVADRGLDQLLTYSLNQQTGALTEVSRTAAVDPLAIELEPNNQFIYTSQNDGNLNGFSRGANGTLTPLAGFPVRFAAPGAQAFRFAFRDRFLFIGDRVSRTLNAFSIGTSGQLTPLAGYPVPGGSGDVANYPLPTTPFLYAADRPANQINAFNVASNGAVTALPSTPAGGAPNEVLPVILTF